MPPPDIERILREFYGLEQGAGGTLKITKSLLADTTTVTVADLAAVGALNPADLAVLDVATLGTVEASKAVTADANKDVTALRNVTATGEVVVPAVQAADGSAGNGAALSVEGGAGDGEGNDGGDVDVDGGAGVAATSGSNGGDGGDVNLDGGAGGGCEEDTGGAGGLVNITGGAGGGSTTAAATGGAGGAVVLTGGDGGADGEGGSGTGGAGGNVTLVPGAGGAGDTAGATGQIRLDGRTVVTDGVTSGTNRRVGGLAYANVAVSATPDVSVDHSEAVFDKSYTIPANTIKAGTVLKIRAWGKVVDNNDADTLTVQLRIGGLAGQSIVSSGAVDVEDNDIFVLDATVLCFAPGATATLHFAGMGMCDAPGSGLLAVAGATAGTVDTTGALDVVVTHDWSAAHEFNNVYLDGLVVEII